MDLKIEFRLIIFSVWACTCLNPALFFHDAILVWYKNVQLTILLPLISNHVLAEIPRVTPMQNYLIEKCVFGGLSIC